jgi:hypothetical protein
MRLAALRAAAQHEQAKVTKEQQQLHAKEANLARMEKKVSAAVARDQASMQEKLAPSEQAVFKVTSAYSKEQKAADSDMHAAQELRAAMKYEQQVESLDARRAQSKGQLSLQDATMMANLQSLSRVERTNAAALSKLAGADAVRLAALVAKVRHESAIAYEQQQEAARLKKKGQTELGHTLEHIAMGKTKRVNTALRTVHELNETLAALRVEAAKNETAATRDESDALEMQFLSKINAQEALMWNHDDQLLHQKMQNSSSMAALLERQAAMETAVAHAKKRLMGVKVGQWMLQRVQLQQKVASHKRNLSPLQSAKAEVKKMRTQSSRDVKLASQMAALAQGVKKKLALARASDAATTLNVQHATQLAHASIHSKSGPSGVDLDHDRSESGLAQAEHEASLIHQAVHSAGTQHSSPKQGHLESKSTPKSWHGVEGPTDYSHGW